MVGKALPEGYISNRQTASASLSETNARIAQPLVTQIGHGRNAQHLAERSVQGAARNPQHGQNSDRCNGVASDFSRYSCALRTSRASSPNLVLRPGRPDMHREKRWDPRSGTNFGRFLPYTSSDGDFLARVYSDKCAHRKV